MFFEMAGSCEYVSVYDIKSCYHQVSMAKDHRKYLGFSWFINGKQRYFIFKVVPFGICSGPSICKNVFRPLIVKWRSEGIPTVLFFDDGIVGGGRTKHAKKPQKQSFKILCFVIFSPQQKSHVGSQKGLQSG